MIKLCIFGGATLLGWVGWWLGEQISGEGAALAISSAGSLLGAYAGWRLARALE